MTPAASPAEALRPDDPPPVELLLLGGRSGAGKTTTAAEVSEQLQAAGLAHCLVDGDALDAAHPKPQGDPTGQRMTLTNLRALWGTFRAAGHWRCVYVNTASLLEPDLLAAAVGADRVVGVLLTAGDATVAERLARREVGSALAVHLERSASKAALLDERVGPWAVRVSTDGRTAVQVAADVVRSAGWA